MPGQRDQASEVLAFAGDPQALAQSLQAVELGWLVSISSQLQPAYMLLLSKPRAQQPQVLRGGDRRREALDPEWLTLSSTSKPDKNAITGNGPHRGALPGFRQPGRSS